MSSTKNPKRRPSMSNHLEYQPLMAYLTANDAEKAIQFYKTVFDAQERFRLTDSKTGKVGHAELTLQGQVLMVSDEYPGMNKSPKTLGGVASQMSIMVADTDATYQRALAAGAVSVMPPGDMFYGFRMAVITDPGGQQWMIQHEFEKVSPEEMQRRWSEQASECGNPEEENKAA